VKHETNNDLTVYKPKELEVDEVANRMSQVEFVDITNNGDELHKPFSLPLRDLRNIDGEVE
jgi:hypothetical protein